jgi:hypothetical protein
MKTKALFWRYPRKISLLKDLGKGGILSFLLRKSMKTGSKLGIPSNISLLKGLAGYILGVGQCCEENAPWRGNLEIVKEPKEPSLLSNS